MIHHAIRVAPWVLLAAAWLPAQEATGAQPTDPPPTAEQRLDALNQEVRKATNQFYKDRQGAMKAAAEAGKPIQAVAMRPDLKPQLEKALAIADEYAGTDDAFIFLAFALRQGLGGQNDIALNALEQITTSHLGHAMIGDLGPMLGGIERTLGDRAGPALEQLAKSKDPELMGWRAMPQLKEAAEKAPIGSDIFATAKSNALALAANARTERLKDGLTEPFMLREKFGIGVVAPDIEGIDLKGVPFKLSDYQGKVLFVDFWGDW